MTELNIGRKHVNFDINKVSKDFGFGPIFEDLSFSLNEGEKISIIDLTAVANRRF